MKFRAAVATAAAVPLALGLAACGHDKPDATGYKPSPVATTPAPAPATTKAADPVQPAPVAHLNRVTFLPAMNTALAKQKSWRITGTVTASGTTLMTISGMQSAKPAAASIVMSGAAFDGRTARMVAVGKALYLSLPGKTPAGKYVKITAADLAKSGLRSTLNGADPTNAYKQIAKAMKDAKYVRTQTVDGRKLDQYDVAVDTVTVLKLGGAKTIPKGLPKTLTYTLWMDSAHVIRRMTFDQLGIVLVMTMTDYNKPVHITPPPASKIVK
ncbi:hypothetical protein [Kribbella karoonensis]|uniref:Lipoprotein LprG n=1 Tax=Kribbella karoonensis TaxID=324851 RepID=A0ABN2E3N8_9ACTN